MTKQERIKLDRNTFKKMGITKVKFISLYDYYNDMKNAVTIYRTGKGKDKKLQQFFPNELNPVTLWEEIKSHIEYEILDTRQEFTSNGLVYNVLCQKEDYKIVLLINYNPINKEINYKELEFNG